MNTNGWFRFCLDIVMFWLLGGIGVTWILIAPAIIWVTYGVLFPIHSIIAVIPNLIGAVVFIVWIANRTYNRENC